MGEHLADYRLVQPFHQLQREALQPPDAERGATAITHFQGVPLWASRLRNTLERLEPQYRQRHGLAQEGQPTLRELPPVLCACLLDVMRSLVLQADTP